MSLTITDIDLTLGDVDERVEILKGVALHVDEGEVVAVVGPSGSGKSSLLAVAGLLLRPTSGSITIGGVDTATLPDRERASLRAGRIGFIFQGANLLASLTVRDQLLLMKHLNRGDARRAEALADELLDAVGLGDRAKHRPGQLSGGERQRVGIARALMNDPAVVLADEPTSALDHTRGRAVVELLASQAHTRGVATVLVTHDTTMLDVADRVLEIRDGELVTGT